MKLSISGAFAVASIISLSHSVASADSYQEAVKRCIDSSPVSRAIAATLPAHNGLFEREICHRDERIDLYLEIGKPVKVVFPGVLKDLSNEKGVGYRVERGEKVITAHATSSLDTKGQDLQVTLENKRSYSLKLLPAADNYERDGLVRIIDVQDSQANSGEDKRPVLIEFFTSKSCKRCESFLPILAPFTAPNNRHKDNYYYLEYELNEDLDPLSSSSKARSGIAKRISEIEALSGFLTVGTVVMNKTMASSIADSFAINMIANDGRRVAETGKVELALRSKWNAKNRVAEITYSANWIEKIDWPALRILLILTEKKESTLSSGEVIHRRIVREIADEIVSESSPDGLAEFILSEGSLPADAEVVVVLTNPVNGVLYDVETATVLAE